MESFFLLKNLFQFNILENTQRFINEPFSKEKLSQLPYLDPSQSPLDIPRSVSMSINRWNDIEIWFLDVHIVLHQRQMILTHDTVQNVDYLGNNWHINHQSNRQYYYYSVKKWSLILSNFFSDSQLFSLWISDSF